MIWLSTKSLPKFSMSKLRAFLSSRMDIEAKRELTDNRIVKNNDELGAYYLKKY